MAPVKKAFCAHKILDRVLAKSQARAREIETQTYNMATSLRLLQSCRYKVVTVGQVHPTARAHTTQRARYPFTCPFYHSVRLRGTTAGAHSDRMPTRAVSRPPTRHNPPHIRALAHKYSPCEPRPSPWPCLTYRQDFRISHQEIHPAGQRVVY